MGQEKPISRKMLQQVPAEIIDEATLLDQARDVHAEANGLENQADAIKERLRQQFVRGMKDLATAEGLSSDEFIETYVTLLLKVDRSSMQVRDFFRMMELREAFTPGAPFKTSEGRLLTVEDSDGEVEIRPLLVEGGESSGYELKWQVSTKERGVVLVDKHVETDRDALIAELDTRRYGRGVFSSESIFNNIRQLRRLGEEGKAQSLQDELVERISKYLVNDIFTPHPQLDQVRENLRVLKEIDQEAYDKFIATAKQHAANGTFRSSVLIVVELHADSLKRAEAIKDGKTDYYPPTELEVAQQFVAFVQDGIEVLEAQEATANI